MKDIDTEYNTNTYIEQLRRIGIFQIERRREAYRCLHGKQK